MTYRRQRIRDPLHNIIEFQADEFDDAIWRAIQTKPFQRLRRIKQLGFSELVYPGATHTRFAHSVGVFHTARRLMSVIKGFLGREYQPTRARQALAAALVHDLGHGPFSHAFEDVGKRLGLTLANHEKVSDMLIRSPELKKAFAPLGTGFADDVADIVGASGPGDIYSAVVSSQFDADRLDYMRRDRLMAGTQHGAIDFDWLISNLEVGEVSTGVEEAELPKVSTFVLGPKAVYAAETYVLGLFQLYPTIYFHKATRGAEKLFTELLLLVMRAVRSGSVAKTGLPKQHPIVVFSKNPEKIENLMALDDTVVWGALSMMADATDVRIKEFSERLAHRKLFKCIDVREDLLRKEPKFRGDDEKLDRACASVNQKILDWQNSDEANRTRVLLDQANRTPYKPLQDDKGPLNQIMIKQSTGELVDVAKQSKVIAAVEVFRLFRVYVPENDDQARRIVRSVVQSEIENA